ncbi:MAG: hypothetical protein ABI488_20570 [Polyangiaceae bacterium]
MQIWLANSLGCVAYDRELFTVVVGNLRERRGRSVGERFECLHALSRLPWLDQPRVLDPVLLLMEIYAAWDELWTARTRDLAIRPRERDARLEQCSVRVSRPETLGKYLAAPLQSLAAFAASTTVNRRVRAGTHRELVSGANLARDWRVLQGGLSALPDRYKP